MSSTLAVTALVGGLLIPVVPPAGTPSSPSSSPAPAAVAPTGQTSAEDGVLRRGCRRYSFGYSVTTPGDDWTLDISIRDRTGRAVLSEALLGPGDTKQARRVFTLCRGGTTPGRFRIHGTLTSYDGAEGTTVDLPATTFRLRKRR